MSQSILEQPKAAGIVRESSVTTACREPDGAPELLPAQLAEETSKLPKLTRQRCGYLGHSNSLASQLDGDWSFMSGATGQDQDESFRYQLACMAHGAGAAHSHRLPAFRSVFRGLIQKLITKMLHRYVQGY